MIKPTANQIPAYVLAWMSSPQNTVSAPKKATAGNTGYSGILKPGFGKSFPSRFLIA